MKLLKYYAVELPNSNIGGFDEKTTLKNTDKDAVYDKDLNYTFGVTHATKKKYYLSFQKYSAKTYYSDEVYVVQGTGIYELLNSVRPYESSDFNSELTAGDWALLVDFSPGDPPDLTPFVTKLNAHNEIKFEPSDLTKWGNILDDNNEATLIAFIDYIGSVIGQSINADNIEESAERVFVTPAQKDKLDTLKERFLGEYLSLSALESAHPTAEKGDFAHVKPAGDITEYRWNNGWEVRIDKVFTAAEKSKLANQSGTNTGDETGESIATKYEAYEDVKRFTTALKAKVDSIITTGDGTLFKSNDGTYKVVSGLPDQTGQAGKFVKTDGTLVSWEEIGIADILDLAAQLSAKEDTANKNIAGGYAGIDATTGKILPGFLPDSIASGVTYKGVWDASSGTAPSATPASGEYWRVNVVGTTDLGGYTDWGLNDWVIWNGSNWDQIKNSESFSSINGQTSGAVVIDDNTIDHVPVITIPTWISGVYTAGKARLRAVLDAVISQVGMMKEKLDGVAVGATKNAADADLRKRSTHTGFDPISSIEGFGTAPVSSMPFKKEDGTTGWQVYTPPAPYESILADGTVKYFDDVIEARNYCYDNRGLGLPTLRLHKDTNIDIVLSISLILDLNGYYLQSLVLGIDSKLVGKGSLGYLEIDDTTGETLVITASILHKGTGPALLIKNNASVDFRGDIISEDVGLEFDAVATSNCIVYGNIIAGTGEAIKRGICTVYGNVISSTPDKNVIWDNSEFFPLNPDLSANYNYDFPTIYIHGTIINKNPLATGDVVFMNNFQNLTTRGIFNAGSGFGVTLRRAAPAEFVEQAHLNFLGPKLLEGGINPVTPYDGSPPDLVVNPAISVLEDIVAGANITIDKTNPSKPIISGSGGTGDGASTAGEVSFTTYQDLSGNVQTVIQQVRDIITAIVGGVAPAGDNLLKLYNLITANASNISTIQTALASDNTLLDTFQEVVDFIEANRADLDAYVSALQNKVDKVTGKSLVDDTLIAAITGTELAFTNAINSAITANSDFRAANSAKLGNVPADTNQELADRATLSLTGLLENLTTTDKTNIVSAINEIKAALAGFGNLSDSDIDTLSEINAILVDADLASETFVNNLTGLLGNLTTTAKGNLVVAINEVKSASSTNATEIQTLEDDMLAANQDIQALETDLATANATISTLQKEYIIDLVFSTVLTKEITVVEDIIFTSVEKETGATVTLTGMTIGTLITKGSQFTIEVDATGLVTLNGEIQ